MAKIWFECPDGTNVKIKDCLNSCRMTERCMSLPSLIVISEDRPWTGHVSPSMAGTGIRQYYLKQINDYSINPREAVFMLYGTKHHALKESVAKDLPAFIEEKVTMDGASGTCDYFDGDLIDYKFVGSYSLMRKAKFTKIQDGEYKVNSKYGMKGDPKYKEVFSSWDITNDDDWALQLNYYALMWEDAGYHVNNLYVEATMRDAGLASARKGFDRKVYMIPVPKLDSKVVMAYYNDKQEGLDHAFKNKEVPSICTSEERWDERRCQDFCDVWQSCLEIGDWQQDMARKLYAHKESE